MRKVSFLLVPVLLLLAAACGPGAAEEEPPGADPAADLRGELSPGWNEIRPGGETICALGTEFAFFARPAATDRLVVYLQGSGACWNARTCDPERDPTYSRDVDDGDNPANRPIGIFDLGNPENPVADRSMIMIPYCTGDVHVGDAVASYTAVDEDGTERQIEVHHRGYVNVMAALDWMAERYPDPAEILVAGSSAGSIPSPFYAQLLAGRYPGATITALGDASGSYRRDPEGDDPTLSWNMHEVVGSLSGYEDAEPGSVGFEDFYIRAGEQHSDLRLLQFDAADDAVQQFFVDLSNDDPDPVRDLIAANQADIRAALPDFRAYVAGGPEHTILWRAAFYDYEVGGTLFREWLAAALRGEPVEDVACEVCDRPEVHLDPQDAQIAEVAAEMLAEEPDWSPHDAGGCPPSAAPRSLRCALLAATAEVGGRANPYAAIVLEARFEARTRLGDAAPERGGDPLVAFNAATDHEGVRDLLDTVAERARAHEHAAGTGGPR